MATLSGPVVSLKTMAGGVELIVAGQRAFLRKNTFNQSFYLEVQEGDSWDSYELWDPKVSEFRKALKALCKYSPFVPSNEGVRVSGI